MMSLARMARMDRTPRGLRNNNPCNIRSGARWFGLCKDQTDGTFCQFTDVIYGFRAFFKLCNTYVNKYHIRTLRGFVSRFAPACENNVRAYVDVVSSVLRRHGFPQGVLPPFSDSDWWIMFALCVAYVENGRESVISSLVLPATGAYRMVFGSFYSVFPDKIL